HFKKQSDYLASAIYLSDLEKITIQKNHLGLMHFLIIGEDIEGRIIVKEDLGFESNTSDPEVSTYWLSFDKELFIK
ncbi:MAG: hypothetical protein ACPG5P_03700, partial [Saprospiraceae bacterium]